MRWFGLLFLAGIVTVMWLGSAEQGRAPEPAATGSVAAPAKPREPDPWDNFEITKLEVLKGGFGAVAIADLTFRNGNAYPVKDALVACSFYGASGTKILERQTTVYETFPAKKSRTIKGVNVGFITEQVRSSLCRIVLVSRAT